MADVALVAVFIAFFVLAMAFVRACDRIIGPDIDEVEAEVGDASHDAEQAA
jgi:hypothetical protein